MAIFDNQINCKVAKMLEDFHSDLLANNNPSLIRKKFWVLLCTRCERRSNSAIVKRLIALVKKLLLFGTGCELPSSAFEGGGIKMPHLNGIIVSDQARIGSGCTIFHQVTLGIAAVPNESGAPFIGDDVIIGAGAKVIGNIRVGSGTRIGANAVITNNIPSNSTVVGANQIVKWRD